MKTVLIQVYGPGVCAFALASLALLAACSREAVPAPTVSYYRAHTAERRAQVRVCADDPGHARTDPACINALAAERLEGIGSLDRLPPLEFPAPNAQGDASRP